MNTSEIEQAGAEQKLPPTKEQWTELLKKAKEAHVVYEQSTGKPDEDWAGWYARYIVDEASGHGLVTADSLKALLLEAVGDYSSHEAEAKARGEAPGEWPEVYAGYIHKKLSGE